MTAESLVPPERDAREILSDAAAVTGPALREAITRLPQRIRHPVGVHFGWWDPHGRPQPAGVSQGKRIRPALALGACAAVGGEQSTGLVAAVAIELVHNASLLHDDIIDGDRTRWDRPTLWAHLGMPAAILAGDALFFLATQVLTAAGPPLDTPAGMDLLTDAVQELIEGEYADTLLQDETEVSLQEVEVMAAGKTGALMAAACALGALAGNADQHQTTHLRAFGAHLGAAFQLTDDLLGIWGDPQRTGKPVGSDLRARKKSLPVAAALASDTPAARELHRLYTLPQPLSPEEIDHVACLLDQAGARTWAQAAAHRHTEAALRHLHSVQPAPSAAASLTAIAHLITGRDR
jgi:geranylgeranyl diphosphate synthase type I